MNGIIHSVGLAHVLEAALVPAFALRHRNFEAGSTSSLLWADDPKTRAAWCKMLRLRIDFFWELTVPFSLILMSCGSVLWGEVMLTYIK